MKDKQSDQKTCECVANTMEKKLDPEMFKAVVLQAEGKQEEAQKIIDKLPMDKQFTGAMSAAGAAMECIGAK